jgi:hypothetical protein
MPKKVFAIAILCLLFLQGCGSFIRMGLRGASPVLNDLIRAAYKHNDPELIKEAIPASLLILDGLIEADPENYELLVLASQGYSGYAMAFVEDEDPERAKKLYLRGRDYGLRAMRLCRKFRKALDKNEPMEVALKKLDEDFVPAMFWTVSNWAAYINLSRKETSALFEISDVTALMERLRELNPEYFYGGVHLLYALYYANQPALTGGGPEKAKEEFEKVFKISDNKFLLAHVMFAKFYAVPLKDESLFDSELNLVLSTPSDVLPESVFMNEVAKIKAKKLLGKRNEFFF